MRKLVVVAAAIAAIMSFPALAAAATAPTGVTGIALDTRVELAWQPVSGATGYTVYRGTSATTITTRLTTGVTTTTYADTTAANGTTYYYAVRSVDGGGESGNSLTVQARPVARACSAGNATVLENCYPGNTGWNVANTGDVSAGGIEGFATAASVNKGGSIGLKINAPNSSNVRVEIFRSGYYGGTGARLFSIIRGLALSQQPACSSDSTTGLLDCSNWSTSATLTTTSAWPSGIYLLRIVRENNNSDNHILLIVRDDARPSELLYGLAMSNYQAYNNFGGRSLYDFNSNGSTTVAGTPRAVKVSFDRPFEQPRSGLRDWYTRTDFATVYWLEREGYDVAYQSNTDMERNGSRLLSHEVYMSPAHDEYYSAGMRTSLRTARDAGVDLFFGGANDIYWKIRFENGPGGGQDRIQVCYKSTQSGGADPSGIATGTWRDPAGANQPENALLGVMYVGDNDNGYFPLRVSATEGQDRIWRYTGLDQQAPGTFTSIGSQLIGWEWDARVANGQEPAGVKTLASSPVNGNLLQDAGRVYAPGSTTVHAVKYTASSGALVFSTGTNHWNRGLALNAPGQGEPNVIIQQATVNVLADMGVQPSTPSSDIVLDNPDGRPSAPTGVSATSLGSDSIRVSWNPVSGVSGYNVYRTLVPRQGGQPLGTLVNSSLVTGTSFTDISLSASTTYYYVVTAVSAGVQSLASAEAPATTSAASGDATRVNSGGADYTSGAGAFYRADTFYTGGGTYTVPASRAISGTNDPAMYRDERWGSFSYAIPLVNGVYDVRLHFVELYYGSAVAGGAGKRVFSIDVGDTVGVDVQNLDIYAQVGANTALVRTISNVTVTDGTLNIQSIYGAADDPEIAAIEVIPASTAVQPPSVTTKSPADGATGVSVSTAVQATFSRAMDASTITSSSFTLKRPDGSTVAASVGYDSATGTATLTPTSVLAASTTYTARLETTIRAVDGTALATPVIWSFTTAAPAAPPTVTAKSPADGATGVARTTTVDATFSRDIDASTVTAASFTLTGPGGPVLAVVTYDAMTRTARLTPSSPLAYSTSYAARLDTSIKATDGTPLPAPVSWAFTTAQQPVAPSVTGTVPANGAANVARDTTVRATFSRSMDPSTLTASSFTLTGPAGAVASTVSYDDATRTVTLTPTVQLATGASYTARLDTTVQAADGVALASAVAWSFTATTAACPCSLFTQAAAPAMPSNPTQDGRTGTGPWSYELGVKIRLDQDADLTAIKFWKSPGETGTHKGTVWSASGTKLAEVTFVGESVSGWQQQALPTPLSLQADTTYVVSVNANAFFAETLGGLGTQIVSGYLRSVADGQNGVYGSAAGAFPNQTWGSTNYFSDVVVNAAPQSAPTVTGKTPADGAAGVAVGTSVQASFSRAMNSATISVSTFTLKRPDGSTVPTSVSYDAATRTATLTLSSALANSTTYTAALDTAIAASDGTPLAAPVTWQFTTAAPAAPPTVTQAVPAGGATGVARGATVQATFSRSMDAATLTTSSFTLTGPTGAVAATVAYDDASKVATLTPSAALAAATTYAAGLNTSVKAADGTALASALTWSFTTTASICPCSLLPATSAPASQNNSTRDGRPAPGPWTYELGVKIRVDEPVQLSAIRFWKGSSETGTHKGTVWSASGTKLAEVTFAGESASGWQQQALATPLSLQANTTYVVSVNANAVYSLTSGGLATQIVSGPLRSVADGQNGVYGSASGVFPNQSWASSNYFVDAMVSPSTTAPPTVTAQNPASAASGVGLSTTVQATFSRAMDAGSITTSTFTLKRPDGSTVVASVSYDPSTRVATLTPSSALAYSTTYTAGLDAAIKAADGTALASPVSWTFNTLAQPAAPTVSGTVPTAAATSVARDATVKATFSRSIDPATLTSSSFTLTPSGGAAVSASVSYDDATKTATLAPAALLAPATAYTARLETTVKAADGIALASAVTWSFTTTSSACPCQLFATSASPASSNNPTQDGRPAPGPWSYEFGVKIQVDQAVQLTAIRFWKSSLETGTHKGTVWTSGGTKLGEVTFAGESASGWQQQALGTPIALQPGTIYVISVNANAYYAVTSSGLLNAIVSGPLRSVADGQNGIFGLAAGTFPTQSWASSNYFVDLVVG